MTQEIVTNAIPFPDLPSDGSVILNVVLNGVRPSKIPLVGDGLWDLWTRCWSASPEDRPIMVEVDSKMKALTDCASHRATHTSRKLLASGSYDNVIRVWDAETGEALQTMTARLSPGESGGVDCPRLSPDGSKLSTTTEDWKSRLWKVASEVSQKIPAVNLMFGDTAASSGTNAVVLSPDGTKLVTAGDDKKVRVWDVASAKLLKQITAPYELYSLAFSPSGDKFATCGNSGSNRFYVWHATKYTRDLFKFEGHTRVVKCIAYSPDATKIVSGSDDTAVGVWDTGTGKRVMTFQGHMESIAAVAVSPNNTYVASAGRDQTVRIWSLDTQHILHCLNGHSDLITSIAFSPSGLSIASASRDKTIRVWEVDAGAEKVCLEGHTGEVTSIAFTYEHVLVSGGRDNTIRIWDPENCKEVKRICRKSGPGPGVVASIAHATLFTVC